MEDLQAEWVEGGQCVLPPVISYGGEEGAGTDDNIPEEISA